MSYVITKKLEMISLLNFAHFDISQKWGSRFGIRTSIRGARAYECVLFAMAVRTASASIRRNHGN